MSDSDPSGQSSPSADLAITRRNNVRSLFQEYLERQVGLGVQPKGLEALFAAVLEISPSMWSQIKSSRTIGTKLARQIETHCGKVAGWLDEERVSDGPTPGEQQLLAMCLKASRSTNAVGRKNLKLLLRAIAEGRIPAEKIFQEGSDRR